MMPSPISHAAMNAPIYAPAHVPRAWLPPLARPDLIACRYLRTMPPSARPPPSAGHKEPSITHRNTTHPEVSALEILPPFFRLGARAPPSSSLLCGLETLADATSY